MKRPSIFILLALVLVAASGTLIFHLRSGSPQTAASPKIPALADPFHGKAPTTVTTRQTSNAGTAVPPKIQTAAADTAQPQLQSCQHPADSQIAASPTSNEVATRPNHCSRPSPVTQEIAQVGNPSSLPAIQLADDVRLPAALMPHGTANESPIVAAARAAIGDRFYRELQEIAAKETQTEADATVIIHKSPATENALKRANEEYRAFFGDEAFNRKTMDTHLEVKLPTGSSQ